MSQGLLTVRQPSFHSPAGGLIGGEIQRRCSIVKLPSCLPKRHTSFVINLVSTHIAASGLLPKEAISTFSAAAGQPSFDSQIRINVDL